MNLPQHVAIIMDGNGRWAKARHLPRAAGHKEGVESVRAIITSCRKHHIPHLTLFTLSSENWNRPESEVQFLFSLVLRLLRSELQSLHENNIRIRVIGDKTPFSSELKEAITSAEVLTQNNTALQVNIALNYGGRWDIVEATKIVSQKLKNNEINLDDIDESLVNKHLALSDIAEPDLFIRTSGEYRLSNFLLWQLAYTELYFTDTFWPDFRETQFEAALEDYTQRQRRFGLISEQLNDPSKRTENILETIHA